MSSYFYGKPEVCDWIRRNFPASATVLDVGTCDGNWRKLLREYSCMDGIEAYEPNLAKSCGYYRKLYFGDIRDFTYDWYDLIIFGDIIEHLSVEDAQAVLRYAVPRCRDLIIAVPFLYEQGAIYGNPYEVHIQDDLTAKNFEERYPGFEILCDPGHNYRYYHKGADQ